MLSKLAILAVGALGSVQLKMVSNNVHVESVPFNPDQTVASLKQYISEKEGIPVSALALKYGSENLENSETLSQAGVPEGAQVLVKILWNQFPPKTKAEAKAKAAVKLSEAHVRAAAIIAEAQREVDEANAM